ncbi:MAG: hypothetical protein KatS3mg002_0915 [Candidatus Woesearchaeota archaeon]|nr:MAG: hypothetical protein KatS3mg002_0915 [Candidatus Woesearchaeota archaeon]
MIIQHEGSSSMNVSSMNVYIIHNNINDSIHNNMYISKFLRLFLLIALFLSISVTLVSGATISGKIYDLSLQPITAFVQINSTPNQFMIAKGEYSFNIKPGEYVLIANTSEGSAIEYITVVEDGEYVLDIIVGLDINDPSSLFDVFDEYDITDEDSPQIIEFKNIMTPAVISIIIIVLISSLIVFVVVSKKEVIKDGKKGNNKKSNIKRNTLKKQVHTSEEILKKEKISESKEIKEINIKTDSNIKENNSSNEQENNTLESKLMNIIKEHSRITQKEIRKMLPYSEAKISLLITQLESEGKIKKIKKGRGNIIVYVKS